MTLENNDGNQPLKNSLIFLENKQTNRDIRFEILWIGFFFSEQTEKKRSEYKKKLEDKEPR